MHIRFPERLDIKDICKIDHDLKFDDVIKFAGRKNTRILVAEEGNHNVIGFVFLTNSPSSDELIVERLKFDINYKGNKFEDLLLDKVESYNLQNSKLQRRKIIGYAEDSDVDLCKLFAAHKYSSSTERNRFGQDRDGIKFVKKVALDD